MFNQGVKAYAQVKVETAVSTANPVQLVVLLYEGAISAIASAKGEMERGRARPEHEESIAQSADHDSPGAGLQKHANRARRARALSDL